MAEDFYAKAIRHIRVDIAEMPQIPDEMEEKHGEDTEPPRHVQRQNPLGAKPRAGHFVVAAALFATDCPRKRLNTMSGARKILVDEQMTANPKLGGVGALKADHRRLFPKYCRAWCARRRRRRRFIVCIAYIERSAAKGRPSGIGSE